MIDPSDIRLTTVTLENPYLITENDNVSINIEFDLGIAVLRSITGYGRSEVDDLDDCAGIPILLGCVRGTMPGKHNQWSQELQLVSQAGTAVDWLAGAYYYDDETSQHLYLLTPEINPNPTNDRNSTSEEAAYAAFGQATWHVNESWGITGGVRLNNERQQLSTIGTGVLDSTTLATAEYDGITYLRLDLNTPSPTMHSLDASTGSRAAA
jgi:iron complex outermembrane receptor protein